MTPEELEDLVKRSDAMAVADALGGLSESERSKLSKHAEMLLKECNQYADKFWDIQHGKAQRSPVMERLFGDDTTRCRTTVQAAETAAFGLCPLSVVRKVEFHERDALIQVLSLRRPEWINDWLETQFKKPVLRLEWGDYWRLYKSGACSKPTSDDYYRFLTTADGNAQSLSDFVAGEPSLQEDVWRLFEVETIAFAFDWPEGSAGGRESWTTAVCRLAQRGTIDRQRLLDAALNGLTTGFKNNVLTGFAGVHDRLEPTIDEMAARQATYADLLNVKSEQVVAFAITMFKNLDQAKRLDDELFVGAAPAVFGMPTKARAKATLDLLKKIGKRSPQLRPRISEILIDFALVHPVDDVVKAALELITSWPESLSADIVRRLSEVEVPVAAQALLRELVAEHGGSKQDAAATLEAPARNSGPPAEVIELDARWRKLAGVDEAAAAGAEKRWPEPLQFSMHDVPVLSGVEPVVPIGSTEELRDVLAHCVEVADGPFEVERIVDGISRFGRDESDSFQRLAAPLIARMRQLAENWTPRHLVTWGRTPIQLVRLVQWWLSFAPPTDEPNSIWVIDPSSAAIPPTPMYGFLDRFYKELLQRLMAGHTGPVLSMPTHHSGWIDPRVFVERWRESLQGGVPILKADAVLGILRLAPDHRDAALASAAEIKHPWIGALGWALGDAGVSPQIHGDEADLWIASANARGNDESFAALRAAGLDEAGPDGATRSAYQWNASMREIKRSAYSSETEATASVDLTVQPGLPQLNATLDRPSVFLHARCESPYWREAQWMIGLLTTLSPGNVSGQIARGIEALMARLDAAALANEGNEPLLRPLFDVDRPIDDLACLLLLVGLCSKDEDVRRLAIDGAVESIQDGRLHPAILGPTLARLAVPDWLKLNRLCANLEEVARVSSMHAWVVCESLNPLLAAYEELPRDAHHLLALLEKLLIPLGGELPAAAKQRLTTAGGGKTGKLAKGLLKLTAHESPAAADARQQLLQSRVERAQRWQGGEQDFAAQDAGERVLQRS